MCCHLERSWIPASSRNLIFRDIVYSSTMWICMWMWSRREGIRFLSVSPFCWHLFACKQFLFGTSTPFNGRAASRVTKELASTCHFAVDHTWQSQLGSDCLKGPTPADTGWEGGGAGRGEWQHRCIIHLFIIPSLFSSHHSKPTKKQPALSLLFSVSANVICRSVTETMQTRKDVFSAWI